MKEEYGLSSGFQDRREGVRTSWNKFLSPLQQGRKGYKSRVQHIQAPCPLSDFRTPLIYAGFPPIRPRSFLNAYAGKFLLKTVSVHVILPQIAQSKNMEKIHNIVNDDRLSNISVSLAG